ncbi:BRO family protein [Microbacterium sp. NPDC058269]|uniref:BRO family protein n=1 Tax=Microbacterium sp. NPDC058269 TaxID=3346414 RepID=UPI0036D8FF26
MTDLERFNFQELPFRVAMIDGEPWFVAVDVCNALDIDNATQALTRLDEDERTLISNEGRQVNAVNEAGLYSIILGSRKPEARAFKRWVTHEVLPTIRKTGSYQAPTGTDLLALAVIEAQQMLEASTRQVAELTPRAEAWDELASATGDYEVADAAKMLARAGVETGRQRLFGQLSGLGWIYRAPSGKWKARQSAVDAGYLTEKPQSHHHPRTGELVLDPPQVRVTVRGLERLRVRLGRVVALEVAS